jgi:molybdopterin-biosynthesis enzyme MoeA-like protein
MEEVFQFIKNDQNSVMFSFGGIGATPDDYTRQVASNIFTNGKMETNKGAKKAILEKFGKDAYPHRINMATLPLDAKLLKNVVSNVPGFYLEDRFFFTPGFPSMSRSMIVEALDKLYPSNTPKYRLTLTAFCSENLLVDTMKLVPFDIDMSSLPQIDGDKRTTVISLCSDDRKRCQEYFLLFENYLIKHNIKYLLSDTE